VALVIDNPADMRVRSVATRATGRSIALVPTMGALHRGHLELIAAAAHLAEHVVVSIFVNPLQFGEDADFTHYPRPLDADLEACDQAGVHVVYVPTAATMYPDGFATNVHVAKLTDTMEGASRPGHFDGVATVVTKLFAATSPDVAIFGEKDYQQLAIVRRLARDLDLGIEIVAHPTVREDDGVALSSRNRRLSEQQRRAATCLPKALAAAVEMAQSADAVARQVIDTATRLIQDEPLATLDYVSVFDADTLETVDRFEHRRAGRTRIALAAWFGDIRLIDNTDLFTG
jgi:pantoate--beta-alanine ligase